LKKQGGGGVYSPLEPTKKKRTKLSKQRPGRVAEAWMKATKANGGLCEKQVLVIEEESWMPSQKTQTKKQKKNEG